MKRKVRRIGGTVTVVTNELSAEQCLIRDPYGGTFGVAGYGPLT